jgi:hypothetical protein
MWKKKMSLIVNSRPLKKMIERKRNDIRQKQGLLTFINSIQNRNNILRKISQIKKKMPPPPQIANQNENQNVNQIPHYRVIECNFEPINLKSDGNRIPQTILSDLSSYEKYNFNKENIPTAILHENEEISKLLNVYNFLYENGGIYLNKQIKTHPCIFIKNHEFIAVNIDFFSCEKKSPTIKKILDDANQIVCENGSFHDILLSFYKNIDKAYRFNKSIHLLI